MLGAGVVRRVLLLDHGAVVVLLLLVVVVVCKRAKVVGIGEGRLVPDDGTRRARHVRHGRVAVVIGVTVAHRLALLDRHVHGAQVVALLVVVRRWTRVPAHVRRSGLR